MNKKHLYHAGTKLYRIRPEYLLGVALISAVVCVFALRANNERMLQLKQALYSADQNNGDVQQALRNLQSYVTSHMNTSLATGNTSVYPPVQLAGTYDRLVQAQSAALQQQNSQIYTEAQDYCEKTYSTASLHTRVVCTEDYAASHGMKAAAPIPDSLYKFDFLSPRWSPDLAGWTMLIAILSGVAGLLLLAVRLAFRKAG